MRELLLLLKKDLLIEAKTKEVIALQFCMSVLLGTLCAVGMQESFLALEPLKAILPTFIWIVFLFSATLAIGRSFEYEFRNDAIYGLFLSGATPANIFISKFLVNTFVIFVGQFVSVSIIAILTTLHIFEHFAPLAILFLFVSLGFSAISTLLMPMTIGARLKSMLLPIILLPLIFPVLFAGLELGATIFDSGEFSFDSIWFSILLIFDVIYIALGINLFDRVILE